VLFWIPSHILLFVIRHADDYRRAGVSILSNAYSEKAARLVIGVSTGVAVAMILLAAQQIGLSCGCLWVSIGLDAVLIVFDFASVFYHSSKLDLGLFKMLSLYMLGSMGLIMLGV
jgi:heme O synthase-like polyprenyltransferase